LRAKRKLGVSGKQRKTRVKHNRIRSQFLAVLFDPRVAFYTGTGI
jgi:hypothetical protein